MSERRYTEAEMAEIFERATREAPSAAREGGGALPARSDGFTLRQLQEIGREVGISAEAVARGAAALQARGDSGERIRRVVGAPLGVSRVVSLPRKVTDEEWHGIVAALRDHFDANGAVRETGEFREWRNGNLSVALEPEGEGTRLRMRTRKSGGEVLPIAGVGLFGISAFAAVYGVLQAGMGLGPLSESFSLLFLGTGLWTAGFANLHFWSKRRLAQFRELGERILGMAAEPRPGELPPAEEE